MASEAEQVGALNADLYRRDRRLRAEKILSVSSEIFLPSASVTFSVMSEKMKKICLIGTILIFPLTLVAEPFVKVKRQVMGRMTQEVVVDSALLKEIDGKYYPTCEFVERVHGEVFFTEEDWNYPSDPKLLKRHLTMIHIKALQHEAISHFCCQKEYGEILEKLGRDPSKVLSEDWRERDWCMYIDALKKCTEARRAYDRKKIRMDKANR